MEDNTRNKFVDLQDTLISSWKKVAISCGNKIAAIDKNKQITYQMLDSESDHLAAFILNLGCKSEDSIAVLMERSVQYIVTFLGILKAGGCIVPIDIDSPPERLSYILKDSDSKILFTDKSAQEKIEKITIQCDVFQVDRITLKNICLSSSSIQPCSLAYILYTSGTLGIPKGIMVEHRNVVNLITWFITQYCEYLKHCIQLASIGFDVSIEEIFGSLLSGATLHIPPKIVKTNKKLFKQYVDNYKISIIQTVPMMLKELIMKNDYMKTVEIIITGGDVLNEKLKNNILERGYQLYNHYGSIETTVDATFCKCYLDKKVTIGTAIDHVNVYIANNGVLVNKGEIGEIYITGSGVSRGYVDSRLSEISFIMDSNISADNKLYKTGDLGMIDDENNIIFCGRIDKQIKRNGIRFELCEIEKLLSEIEGIEEAVVTLKDTSNLDKKICAFYLGDRNEAEIRIELAKRMPAYAIPTYISKLDQFQYNLNDKLSFHNQDSILSEEDVMIDIIGEKILQLLSECSEISKDDLLKIITVPLSFSGIDSFVFVHLLVELESEYNIIFNEDEMMLENYFDLSQFIMHVKDKISG